MSPNKIVLVSGWSADPIGDEFFDDVDLCSFLLGPSQCPFPFSCETDCVLLKRRKMGGKLRDRRIIIIKKENEEEEERRKRWKAI